jgi:hypothetical protein
MQIRSSVLGAPVHSSIANPRLLWCLVPLEFL